MPTEKIYFTDPFRSQFDANIVRRSSWKGAPSLILDRTAFFPEGGGQLSDCGTLFVAGMSLAVVDVQIDDAGDIHHVIKSDPGDVIQEAASVQGSIDFVHRRDQMSQHTGQHLLSAAILGVTSMDAVASRLGSEASTIDLPDPSVGEAVLAKAEDLANHVVLDDRPVRSLFPTPEELPSLPLRCPPKVEENIRVIDIEGFDMSPCGGTHCTRTGQVGFIRITGTERYKRGIRLTFLAGRRALHDARKNEAILRELSRAFTCGPSDVMTAITKLRSDLRATNDELGMTRSELMSLVSRRLLAERPKTEKGLTRIAVQRSGDNVGGLRALASALARRPDVVAMAAAKDEATGNWLIVVERGAEASSFDAGKWIKAKTSKLGGRGGGRPERAEARLCGKTSWEALKKAFVD